MHKLFIFVSIVCERPLKLKCFEACVYKVCFPVTKYRPYVRNIWGEKVFCWFNHNIFMVLSFDIRINRQCTMLRIHFM